MDSAVFPSMDGMLLVPALSRTRLRGSSSIWTSMAVRQGLWAPVPREASLVLDEEPDSPAAAATRRVSKEVLADAAAHARAVQARARRRLVSKIQQY